MLFCQYIVTNCHISLVMTAWPKFKEYFQELMNNPNYYLSNQSKELKQCTEVCFASFLSGGFTTMAVMNPLERILAKRTSKQCNMYLVHVVYGSTRLGIWVSWLNRTGHPNLPDRSCRTKLNPDLYFSTFYQINKQKEKIMKKKIEKHFLKNIFWKTFFEK